ncbi:MAG: helix-turn-helix transcriptional regulator [Bacteroidetes bacterium]|nr:helix-turn-helix transcriptional regulator [Bacteroidota bacterium]
MKVKLLRNDLKEIIEEYSIHNFSMGSGIEENILSFDNDYGKSTTRELMSQNFCITESNIQCYKDCELYSEFECSKIILFSAILRGNINSSYFKEENWVAGSANMFSIKDGIKNYYSFKKDNLVKTIDFRLSLEYMERIASWYPELFENIVSCFRKNNSFKVFSKNIMLCPEILRVLNNIFDYKVDGNSAVMFLDSKILEVLSLMVCKTKNIYCGSCYSAKDSDMFCYGKNIVEEQYKNPPSLHQLALMMGTNVCKLKTGFKELFGKTVFEYLFDYRMELACKYLLDSSYSIQEVADSIGYEYHSHFSTAFKRKYGLSPLEYRNSIKQERKK